MINQSKDSESQKNRSQRSRLQQFIMGTTAAATMALTPIQNVVAADVSPQKGNAPMPGWYIRQNDGKFIPFNGKNPEHTKAPKVYKLALNAKTGVYEPVHEESKTQNEKPRVFATVENIGINVTNAASKFMGNTMGKVGNALSYIGKPATPQPIHIPRNSQIPPKTNVISSNPQSTLASLVLRARKAEQLKPSGLRKARADLASIQGKVEISKTDNAILNLWLYNKNSK